MNFEKIYINAFGKLSQITLEFHPRLNLIFGPNEAGKSTLQHAILYLLYGFFQSNRAAPQERALLERYFPWQETTYGGQLWYQLQNGNRYNVNRNFSDPDIPTFLHDSLTGEDITKKFNVKRHGNISFLKEQIGMEKDLFESTVFVRQAHMKAIAGSSFLINEIIGVIDSGDRGKSAKQAITRLQQEIAKIGSDRAQKRPYPLARARLQSLKEEFDAQNYTRVELKQAIIEKNKLEKLIDKDKERRNELNYLLLTKNIDQNEKQLNRLKLIKKELNVIVTKINDFEDVKKFPEELHDTITRRRQNRKNYEEQLQEKEQMISDLETKIEVIEKEIKHLKKYETIYSLMPYNDFVNLSEEWRRRDKIYGQTQDKVDQEELSLLQDGVDPKSLQKISDLKPGDFEKYQRGEENLNVLQQRHQQLRDHLDQLESQTWAKSKIRNVILFATFFTTLTLLLLSYYFKFIYGYPASAGLMVLGLIAYQLYRKARLKIANLADNLKDQIGTNNREIESVRTELQKHYQQFGVDSINRLLARRMQNEHYLRSIQEKDKAFQEKDRNEFQLLKYLGSIKINKLDGDIIDKVDSEYSEFDNRFSEIKSFQQEIAGLKKNMSNLQARMSDNNAALKELFDQANITKEDIVMAEEDFDQLSKRRKQLNMLDRDREKYISEINGILASQSEIELQKDSENLILQRELLLAKYPDIQKKQSQKSISQLEKDYAALDDLCQENEKEIHALQTRIQTVLGQHRPQAEIEEEISQEENELNRLEKQRTSMELARDILSEVAQNYHRNVVPFINSILSNGIKRITDKRYSDVHVNPDDMSLNLVLPEKGNLGPADVLSLGTQEQLYLLLRIALARLFSQNTETVPLLLDDPFVHFDHSRMANMLSFLAELSQENQIILLTKEPYIIDWCEKELGQDDYNHFDLMSLNSKNPD